MCTAKSCLTSSGNESSSGGRRSFIEKRKAHALVFKTYSGKIASKLPFEGGRFSREGTNGSVIRPVELRADWKEIEGTDFGSDREERFAFFGVGVLGGKALCFGVATLDGATLGAVLES